MLADYGASNGDIESHIDDIKRRKDGLVGGYTLPSHPKHPDNLRINTEMKKLYEVKQKCRFSVDGIKILCYSPETHPAPIEIPEKVASGLVDAGYLREFNAGAATIAPNDAAPEDEFNAEDENVLTPQEIEAMTLEELREELDKRGIKYHHNAGEDKLAVALITAIAEAE